MNLNDDATVTEETPRPLRNTFGGRGLDRYVYDFEATGEPAIGDLGGSEVAPPAVTPPPAVPAVPPVVEEPAAPAPLTREDVLAAAREAAMEGSGEAFRAMVAQAEATERARAASVPQALPEWDPYDPQIVTAHIIAGLTPILRGLEERANAGASAAADADRERGRVQAHEILDGLKKGEGAIGEFDNDRAIAAARLTVMLEPGTDPEEALKRAAAAEVAYAESLVQSRMAALGLVAEAHLAAGAEPASGGASAGEVSTLPRGKDAYKVQLNRSLAARGLRPGVTTPA